MDSCPCFNELVNRVNYCNFLIFKALLSVTFAPPMKKSMKKYCLIALVLFGSLRSSAFGYDAINNWILFTGSYQFMNDRLDVGSNLGGSDRINAMAEDGNGNIWMAVGGKGLRMFDGKKITDIKIPKESFARNAEILSMAIDSKNTVWVGTSKGLVKFDGSAWINIDRESTGLLAITGIAITATDKLYLTGAVPTGPKQDRLKGGGLAFYNGQTWTNFTIANTPAMPDDSLENLMVDNNNQLWAIPGKGDAGVAKFDGKNWKVFNTRNTPMTTNNVRGIATNKTGKIFIATTNGIVTFDGAEWKDQAFVNGFNSKKLSEYTAGGGIDITSIKVENNGSIWIATASNGVFCIRDKTFKVYNQENSLLPRNSVSHIMVDKDNRKWFTTGLRNESWGGYVLRDQNTPFMTNAFGVVGLKENDKVYDTKWEIYDESNTDLKLGSTVSIDEDKEGNIWMPNDADGLVKYKSGVRTIYRNGGEFGSAFNKMFIAPDGKIYLNTNISGIKVFEQGAFKDFAKWPNMGGVTDMAYDKDGAFWASGTGGLSLRKGAEWETFNKKNGDLPSIIIYTVFKDSKSMLWAGTAKGLVKYDGTTFTVLRKSDVEFPSDDITAIAEDSKGRLWFGTKAGISIYDGATWSHISKIESPKINRPTVNGISFDSSGMAWIATNEDGLLSYNGTTWTQYNRKNGYPVFDKVTAVKAAADGNIYIASEYFQFGSDVVFPTSSPNDQIEKDLVKKIKTSDPKKIIDILHP